MSKFEGKPSNVIQMIFFSAPISIPNINALAQIRFEISCTQDFQILFSKGHNSKKGHNSDMKKIWVKYFFMRNLYMKYQNPSIHRSKVSNFTESGKIKGKVQNSFFCHNLTESSQKLISSSTPQPQPVYQI